MGYGGWLNRKKEEHLPPQYLPRFYSIGTQPIWTVYLQFSILDMSYSNREKSNGKNSVLNAFISVVI